MNDLEVLDVLQRVKEDHDGVLDASLRSAIDEAIQRLGEIPTTPHSIEAEMSRKRDARLRIIGEVIKCLPEYAELIRRWL